MKPTYTVSNCRKGESITPLHKPDETIHFKVMGGIQSGKILTVQTKQFKEGIYITYTLTTGRLVQENKIVEPEAIEII